MVRELQRKVSRGDDVKLALKWTEAMLSRWLEGGEAAIFIGDPRRSLSQNSKLWPMLHDIANQVQWQVNGEMRKLSPDDWKDILTAAYQKHQRVAVGIDGGFVLLGARTSKMGKREMAELIESVYAFGAERGVAWSEP